MMLPQVCLLLLQGHKPQKCKFYIKYTYPFTFLKTQMLKVELKYTQRDQQTRDSIMFETGWFLGFIKLVETLSVIRNHHNLLCNYK